MNSLTNARNAVRRGMQHLLLRGRRKNTTDSSCSGQAAGFAITFIRSTAGLEERERHTRFKAHCSCFTSFHMPPLPLHSSNTTITVASSQCNLLWCCFSKAPFLLQKSSFPPMPSPSEVCKYLLACSFSLLVWHGRPLPCMPAFSLFLSAQTATSALYSNPTTKLTFWTNAVHSLWYCSTLPMQIHYVSALS